MLRCSCILLTMSLMACASGDTRDPEKAHLHLKIGTGFLQSGRYPQALSELLTAEKLDPENATIRNNLGIAFYVRGRFSEAQSQLKKAIKLNPKYTEARNNYGRVLMELGLNDEAIVQLKMAVADLTYPFPEKSSSNLGIAYFRKGLYKKALVYLRESLRLRSSHCLTSDYLGRGLFELGRYNQAAATLDQAAMNCNSEKNEEPIYYGAMAYFKLKKPEDAEARFQEVISKYPNGKYAEQSNKMLKLIKKIN